jgi:nucleoside-diphosphate-sugar epimerase
MRACFYLSGGISSVGLRPWTVYGVGRDRGLTAGPTLAIRAVALWQPFRIRLTGHMDLQYVADVAESFVRYARACARNYADSARRRHTPNNWICLRTYTTPELLYDTSLGIR